MLLAEVPEAMVVWTHREPAVALASWCSLAAVLSNAASDQVDLGALGRRWLEFWATEMDRGLAAGTAPIGTRWVTSGWTQPWSTGASPATANGQRRSPRRDPAARYQADGQQVHRTVAHILWTGAWPSHQ